MYNLIVVGDGIAATCFLFDILHKYLPSTLSSLNILQLSHSKLAPAASENSTGLLALHGARQGVSPLGDSLVAGTHKAKEFFQQFNPPGVSEGWFFSLCPPDDQLAIQSFRSRYQGRQEGCLGPQNMLSVKGPHSFLKKDFSINLKAQAYVHLEDVMFLDKKSYLHWARQELYDQFIQRREAICFTQKNALVVSVSQESNKVFVKTLEGETLESESVVLMTGAYMKLWDLLDSQKRVDLALHPHLQNSQIVSGSYWETTVDDWGDVSFGVQWQKANLLYRGQQKKLIIGASQENAGAMLAPTVNSVQLMHERFRSLAHWPGKFPDFLAGKLVCGLRHKGPGRRPFIGRPWELWDRVYTLCGTYKNGLALSFDGAQKLREQMIQAGHL